MYRNLLRPRYSMALMMTAAELLLSGCGLKPSTPTIPLPTATPITRPAPTNLPPQVPVATIPGLNTKAKCTIHEASITLMDPKALRILVAQILDASSDAVVSSIYINTQTGRFQLNPLTDRALAEDITGFARQAQPELDVRESYGIHAGNNSIVVFSVNNPLNGTVIVRCEDPAQQQIPAQL